MMDKKAIVVEGGAMRGVFASGVLDYFMEENYMPYNLAIGVSAGSSNLVGYLSQSPSRSIEVITQLATTKDFFNPIRFFKGGSLIDVKWLTQESNRLFPIDENKLFHTIPFFAVTTNLNTGKADYHKVSENDFVTTLVATSALPIVYKETPCLSGRYYVDGGIADSIPVMEAYRLGAKEITVILSRPLSYEKKSPKIKWLIKKLFRHNPNIANAIIHRAENYNNSLEFIKNPPKDVSIKVIAPPANFPVKRFTMNKNALIDGYNMGIQAGRHHLM